MSEQLKFPFDAYRLTAQMLIKKITIVGNYNALGFMHTDAPWYESDEGKIYQRKDFWLTIEETKQAGKLKLIGQEKQLNEKALALSKCRINLDKY